MSELFQQLAVRIADNGIRHVFGITGSGSSLKLINALADHGVAYHAVHHEAAAGLMAGGACFDADCRAAALTIKGPGFANLLPALLCNHYESRPALSISEAYPASVPDHQRHKRLDHGLACQALTKSSLIMDGAGKSIDQAVLIAEQETPGPVHIDLIPNPGESSGIDMIDHLAPNSVRDQATLVRIAGLIEACSRPVIVLGSWAMRQQPGSRWLGAGVPIVTTAAAKGAVDESSPLSAGIMTGEASDYSPESNLLAEADLVVAFGLRNNEVIRPGAFQCPLVCIDSIPLDAPSGFAPAEMLVTPADASADVQVLLERLGQRAWGEQQVAEWRQKTNQWILQDDWQAGPAFQRLQFGQPRSRLVLDTGFFCTIGETIWRAGEAGDVVGSGVGRFMGVGIPTAIGVAISDPGRPVVCAVGDGGIGAYAAELQLAATENLPIQFVHMSDGGYGSVAAFSDGSQSSLAATSHGQTEWHRVAEGFGLPSALIDNMNTFDQQLAAWRPEQGPQFLSLAFDPDRYRTIAKALR